MSTIGIGTFAFIPLVGLVVIAGTLVVAAAAAAGAVTLIGAGAKGAMYCGSVLKNKLDEREQQIMTEEQAYFSAALTNQAGTDQAIQSLADSIILETISEVPVLDSLATPSAQVVAKMQQEVAKIQEELDKRKASAEETSRFLKEYRAQRSAERQKREISKKQQQLKNRLVSAQKAGVPDGLAKEIEAIIQSLESIAYEQALNRWQEGIGKLDDWVRTQAVQSQVAVLRYENQRAMQEFEEVALYVQRESLSAAQDIDLDNWVADALHEAENILKANQTRLDQDPASARTGIEKARLLVVNAMADARERLQHDREDLKSQVAAARAKLKTVTQMSKEMEMIGIPVEATSQVSQLEGQLDDLETTVRRKSKPIVEIREKVVNLKSQVVQLRASLERDLARRQREGIAKAIEEVLNELNYQSETEQKISAEMTQNTWRVAGYRPTTEGVNEEIEVQERKKAGVIFRITEDAEGNMRLWHDFQGFKGNECVKAKDEIFSRLREQFQVEIRDEDQDVFDTGYLDNERIKSVTDILKAMGYQNVSVSDIAGAVKIEAYNGPVGYTIRLVSDGEMEIQKDTFTSSVKQRREEFEKEAGRRVPPPPPIEHIRQMQEQAGIAQR